MDEIQKKILKKAERFSKIRTYTDRSLTPKKIIKMFIDSVEDLRDCKDEIEYDSNLDTLCQILDAKMKTFDPFISMEVQWFNTGEESDFRLLQISGVKIIWSNSYLNTHPGVNQEQIFDASDILLED